MIMIIVVVIVVVIVAVVIGAITIIIMIDCRFDVYEHHYEWESLILV
jgi:hypothetical protein